MIKTLLFCSLLVGSAKAMTIGPTFHDKGFNPKTIIDLGGNQIFDDGKIFETPSKKVLTWDELTFSAIKSFPKSKEPEQKKTKSD